jgi:hypothetical protein
VDAEDDDRISLGLEDHELLAPGPDERDMDLMDGSWEQRYYSGQHRGRDWNSIGIGVALLLIIGMVLPGILVILR